MKTQASLEFVLILSALSAIMLVALIYYGKDSAVYAHSPGVYANTSLFRGIPYLKTNNPGLLAYVNQTSKTGKKNLIGMILYGCPTGYANITITSNSSSILYGILQKINFSGTSSATDYFMPANAGIVDIKVQYSIYCPGQMASGTYDLSSFSQNSLNQTGNTTESFVPSQLSAYISQRNESLLYANMSSTPIYSLGESSHCTSSTFSGTPLPASEQCPNMGSWDYQVFSGSCYTSGQSQTETYCIYPMQTGYYLKSPSSLTYGYKYNFSLGIYNGTSAYLSTINSSSNSAKVLYNGANVGSANVTSVYSQPYYPNLELISNFTSSKFANSSYVNAYDQAKTSAFSTFSFYNNSAGDQSAIQQQFTEFNNAAQQLMSAGGEVVQGCGILSNSLSCRSPYPFQYSINVKLGKGSLRNQTLYAEGSKVTLNNS